MRGSMIGGPAAALALCALAAPASAASLELRDVVARVVIIPEARSDIAVIMVKTNPQLPLTVRQGVGDRTVIEASWRKRVWWMPFGSSVGGCGWEGDQPVVRVFGVGAVTGDDLPKIVVRVPMDAQVRAGGAVFGDVGRSDSLELSVSGCGKWTVANVRDRLMLHDAGSTSVRTGSAGGGLDLAITGSGDVTTRAIMGGLNARIAGAGEIDAEQASGPVRIQIAGHGDIRIAGGHADSLDVRIAGSGDVDYKGVADSLNAQIAGSGDITVTKVTGPITKSIAGAGTVTVGP